MFQRDRISYIKERAGMALFIASHRGNLDLVKTLIEHGKLRRVQNYHVFSCFFCKMQILTIKLGLVEHQLWFQL